MTHQEFNHLFYKHTKSKKGIKPMDTFLITGFELKEFVDFAIEQFIEEKKNQ